MYNYFSLMILIIKHPLVWTGGVAAELPPNANLITRVDTKLSCYLEIGWKLLITISLFIFFFTWSTFKFAFMSVTNQARYHKSVLQCYTLVNTLFFTIFFKHYFFCSVRVTRQCLCWRSPWKTAQNGFGMFGTHPCKIRNWPTMIQFSLINSTQY